METRRSSAACYAAARDRILVRACLLELGELDRELLELCLFHGWSTEEVGHYLGMCEVEVAIRVADQVKRIEHRIGSVSAAAAAEACWPHEEAGAEPERRAWDRAWDVWRTA